MLSAWPRGKQGPETGGFEGILKHKDEGFREEEESHLALEGVLIWGFEGAGDCILAALYSSSSPFNEETF